MGMDSYHVKVAAEAFAAGMFAQLGCDVSVQYGADQPEYDLIVSLDDKLAKVSVKGSQDGGWGLTQSFKAGRTYSEAAQAWREKHGRNTILCLVQFKGVSIGEAPRVYLARPSDIERILASCRNDRGDTILYEHYTYKKGFGVGTRNAIPGDWVFSEKRLRALLDG